MNERFESLVLVTNAPRGANDNHSDRAIACRRAEILAAQAERERHLQHQKEAEARDRVAFRYD